MPLVSYDQVAPFAGLIEYKTAIRDRAGAMPPWYVEKGIGTFKQTKYIEKMGERYGVQALQGYGPYASMDYSAKLAPSIVSKSAREALCALSSDLLNVLNIEKP